MLLFLCCRSRYLALGSLGPLAVNKGAHIELVLCAGSELLHGVAVRCHLARYALVLAVLVHEHRILRRAVDLVPAQLDAGLAHSSLCLYLRGR